MKIKLDLRIYPLEAILNACYAFIDRAYVFLDTDSKGSQIIISIKSKRAAGKKQMESLEGEFKNELLNCALRYEVAKNNKKIREFIVGRALYSALFTSAVSGSGEEKFDYKNDPLGIVIPWEKKYGRKDKSKVKV